jgi:hypothetical protein
VSGSQALTVKAVEPEPSCPLSGDIPLDPEGYGPLDRKEVRDALINELGLSNPNATPGTGVKKERGGIIWQRVGGDGSFFATVVTDPLLVSSTECAWSISGQPPPPEPGATPIGLFHTHPHGNGEDVYECAPPPNYMGPPYAQYLGQPGAIIPAATPDKNGGGSDSDWDVATTSGFRQYVINKDGRIHRLDPNTPLNQRKNNGNKWEWKNPTTPGCVT